MGAPNAKEVISPVKGRICVLIAAILWSLSGGFAKVLTRPTALGLDHPALHPMTIAFFRVLFAGALLAPAIRPRDWSWRPLMVGMMASFAAMNILFVWALTMTTAANAILLQYTAPLWMYVASIWLLGERPDRRSSVAVLIGSAGIAIIVAGGWSSDERGIILVALASGVGYAAVVLFLRVLRDQSSMWLTVLNHLSCALILFPLALLGPMPSPGQLGLLAAFGTIQMGLPYWLMARGLRSISAQEAGAITLLEPVLNPMWAYLVAGEKPAPMTWLGGTLILAALVWRYLPRARSTLAS
jgi:drug/metabolite transporter (DMT)-like permease